MPLLSNYAAYLQMAAEAVKVVGGVASFYALLKLRKIEKRYLFKATIPDLRNNIEQSLSHLNLLLLNVESNRGQINEVLNYLIVDAKNVRKKAAGDSRDAAGQLLRAIRVTGLHMSWWQMKPAQVLEPATLLDIYGKGRGLTRSLEYDLTDQGWGGK